MRIRQTAAALFRLPETKNKVGLIAYLGVLTAAEIVLSRFLSINTWNLKIGFAFVPVALSAMLFGPLPTAAVAALADLLGAVLFPIGPYFPGFTLTALLTGLLKGVFLCRRQTPGRIAVSVLIEQMLFSFLLNSYWITVCYGSPFVPLLGTRIVQCAILIPVQFIVIWLLAKFLLPVMKKVIR